MIAGHRRPRRQVHRRAFLSAAVAALAALLGALALAPAASAGAAHALAGTFTCSAATPCPGSPTPEAIIPERVAVDEATGDVYVIDPVAGVVDVFDSGGVYLRSLTVPAGSFGFSGSDDDIAVDNSGGADEGNVYVVGESPESHISAFGKAGNFLWQAEAGPGSDTCGVAVDPTGELWTSDYEFGLQQRSLADGSPIGLPLPPAGGQNWCHFGFDSSDDIDVVDWGTGFLYRLEAPAYSLETTLVELPTSSYAVSVDRREGDTIYSAQHAPAPEIAAYSPTGVLLPGAPFASGAAGREYKGVAIDGQTGVVYAADPPEGEVEIFDPLGALTVNVTGEGEVTSAPAGIDCVSEESCAAEFLEGASVTLEAEAASGYVLAGWLGCKKASATSCQVITSASTEVTAVFLREGKQGSQGAHGSAATNGSSGTAGPRGPAGTKGEAGPRGPRGRQGPPGKVTCKVKTGGARPKVQCSVRTAGASSSALRWRLMRGGHAVSHGTARRGRLVLDLCHLRAGRYRLHVSGRRGSLPIAIG